MVDNHNGAAVLGLEPAEEAQHRPHLHGPVLIGAVHPNERVQDHEAGRQTADLRHEAPPGTLVIEEHASLADHVQLPEVGWLEVVAAREPSQAPCEVSASALLLDDQSGACGRRPEPAHCRRAGCHGDGHL